MDKLSLIEYELLNKEYIRCLKLINKYSQNGQKCILFKLKSFECLISKKIYDNVLVNLQRKLIADGYDVYLYKSEILIFWDNKINKISDDITVKCQSKKGKEDVKIKHINLSFGDFTDNLPIKTGIY